VREGEGTPESAARYRRSAALRDGLLILFLSAGLRLVWWQVGPQVIENEGCYYARLGENIAVGRGYLGLREAGLQLLYPPLYPGLIAAGVAIGLTSETAGRFVSFLFGIWTPVLVCLFARRAYGRTAGWLAGALAATHPLLIVASTAVLTDATYLTLALLGLYAAGGMLRFESARAPIVGGVALGLAYLCRQEALILAVALIVVAVVWHHRHRRRAAVHAGLLLAILAVFALPYVAFLWRETGQIRFETKTAHGLLFQIGHEAGREPGELFYGVDADLVETGLSNMSDRAQLTIPPPPLAHRARLAARQARSNLPRLLSGLGALQLGQPVLSVLVALGLFVVPWNLTRTRDELPLLVLAGLTVAPFLLWPFVLDRSLFFLMAPLMVWAGAGLAHLGQWASASARPLQSCSAIPRAFAACVLVVSFGLVGGAAAMGVRNTDEMSQSWAPEVRDNLVIAGWVRDQASGPAVRIMDTAPTVAFYAGAVLVRYPWSDGATAIRYIEGKRIAFLVLREADRNARPYFSEWLKGAYPESLEPVARFEGVAGTTHVYRWKSGETG
jgi:4-amino-4-deoxy-L-arabinose transferase-like glycosyltransferase